MLCTLAACSSDDTTTGTATDETAVETTTQEDAEVETTVQEDAEIDADIDADAQDEADVPDDTEDAAEDALISDVDGAIHQIDGTTLTFTFDGPMMTALSEADAERDGGRYADMELRLSVSLYSSDGSRIGTVYAYYLCDDTCNVTFSNFETDTVTTGDATCMVSGTSITVTMDTAAYEMNADDIAHYNVSLGVYMESGMGAELYSYEI